ncbi:MAG: tetratricopeptide repeat protein [Acidobacteria bacterium]|nr:tetratricopeptide repeat protein [Acidobacteriota bacterium]
MECKTKTNRKCCLWRLGRFDEAERTFQQMLRLNPSDDQCVRFLIDEVKAKTAGEDQLLYRLAEED